MSANVVAAAATATAVVVAVLLALAGPADAISSTYGTTVQGRATYYGKTSGGNCVLRNPVPSMYAGMVSVAMNQPQYENSALCGACLRVSGTGQGTGATPVTGSFMAYVDDLCPECPYGAIDLGMSGDGIWTVSWELVECPNVAGGNIAFYFEGSNPHYYKMQPRNLPSPATRVTIGGAEATRSQDNFFIATSGGGFPASVDVEVWTVLGAHYKSSIPGYSGVVYGSGPSGGSRIDTSVAKAAPASSSGGGSCTADWQRCSGAEGHEYVQYKPCCSTSFECVQSPDSGFWGKQCRQK
jgi:expansin (peptidoglycan-binding protein)